MIRTQCSNSSARLRLAAIITLLAFCWLIPTSPLWAAADPNYYNSVDTTNATTLRQTLHEVIDDHVRFPYTDATTDTWDIINLADEDPGNTNNIIDVYKNASYTKIPGGVGAYNREHTWPKSFGFPDDGSGNYPYTDAHHLRASDASYNSSRSNRPFRNCTSGCTEYTTDDNNGQGGGSGVYPGNSNWGAGSFAQGSWQTWHARKGDVARSIFYMDLRYEGGSHGLTGFSEPDLRLTDNEALIDASNTGVNEPIAYMGMLSVLIQWHNDDPPDAGEIARNDMVESFQTNRNPFVDHPEWVDCVYGNTCTFDSTPPGAPQGLLGTDLNGGVSLSWLANGESDLNGYNVYRGTSPGGPYVKVNGAVVGTNSFINGGLTNGTTYYYVVTAVDTSNNESGDSNEASGTPDGSLPDGNPPAAPTGLAAAAGDTQVGLTWNANGELDLAGYNVSRATTSGGPYSQLNGSLLTATSYNDSGLTNGTTYHYIVTAVDTSTNESTNSAESSATPTAPGTGGGGLILSEVFYNPSSGDDGFEWVELYNGGTSAINLAGYSLGNGGTDYTYSVVQLSGTIQPGATFVVGGPTSSGVNHNPTLNQAINFNPDFQNSGTTADGVALFDVTAASVTGSTVPIDAVLYGSTNSNGLIDETGVANAPEVGNASTDWSIERVDLAGNWQTQSSPNPNSASFGPANTAPTVSISSPAVGATFTSTDLISFSGSASDTEDGSLTSSLTWTSNLDGAIGGGGSFSTALSVGSHTITASVTDSGSLQGSDAITVTVNPTNTAPNVNISAPTNGSSFSAGASISFSGSATDAEDGSLTSGLAWTSNLDGAIGGGGSFSATLSVGSHTITASVTDSGSLQGSDVITVTVNPVAGSSDVILSEVFYNPTGSDDVLEWVELYNRGASAINLAGYSLGNGGTDYTFSLAQLSGTIQPGATFVVGGPTSNGDNYNPTFDLTINFNPDFQNSGTTGDGVALFAVTAASVTSSTVPVDAVIYGPNNNNGLIDETGVANAPEVGDAGSTNSIERLDEAGNWTTQSTPTPNSTPMASECTVNADCSDGLFCNGTEVCNAGTCEAGTAPTCDDGLFCNGTETCNEITDSCDAGIAPACDDGLFCNGAETCNETSDSCDAGTAPCSGGETCNEVGGFCEAGSNPTLWMSFRDNVTIPGVGTVADEDIVSYDEVSGTWTLQFDGSDLGLSSFEIDGLAILPGGDLLLSFRQAGTVGGVSADDSDVVRFTPTSLGASTAGTFSLYFDGSDVGLSSNGEDVDGLTLDAGGNLVVSTQGGFSGSGASGADEDLFLFTGTLGSNTSGSFSLLFDGSDVGLNNSSSEDVDAAAFTASGSLLFSTLGDFAVTGLSGADEDVAEFAGSFGSSTSGSFSMRWDLTALGIDASEDIGSLHLVE